MTIFTNYENLAQISDGENSRVYRAQRCGDRQSVILKILKTDDPTPTQIQRYRQEYYLTQQLQLPGVIRAYRLETSEHTVAIILEDFGGEALRQWVQRYPQGLPIPQFLAIAIKIAEALGQLHAQSIIHNDINPSNIVLNPQTMALKLIDLGIATELRQPIPCCQSPAPLEGTLPYLAPEQTGQMQQVPDYRADFYSLGVTFYELLTGQLPFTSQDPLELVHCHIAAQPPPPHLLKKTVSGGSCCGSVAEAMIPEAISRIVMKLMAKRAEDRYQSAWYLKADLEDCARQWQTKGAIAPPQCLPPPSPRFLSTPSTASLPTPPKTVKTRDSTRLDLATVMQVSQAIASQILLDDLLQTLIKILLEQTDAQTGCLLLPESRSIDASDHFYIAIYGQADSTTLSPVCPLNHMVPEAVVHYVARTRDPVVLDTATQTGPFALDPYLQTVKPHSVLCYPLLHQNQLVGLVYLENPGTIGAFTPAQIEWLQLLSGHAAIALINAERYAQIKDREQHLADYASELEQTVTQRAIAMARINVQLQQEIRQREQAELALHHSQEKLRLITDSVPAGIAYVDAERRYQFVNKAYETRFNRPREAILGKYVWEIVGQETYNAVKHDIDQVLQGQELTIEFDITYDSGQTSYITSILTPDFDQSQAVVGYYLVFFDITDRKRLEESLKQLNDELERLARIDGLTQISNRRCFDDYLIVEWQRHLREQQPLTLILIDIDYFKRYNDYYGHQGGDECLRCVAQALANVPQRPADLVARYGGEEFVAILPNTSLSGGETVAEAMRRAIAALAIPHAQSAVSRYISLSLGVATLVPSSHTQSNDLIAQADEALYNAKHQGRDRVITYSAVETSPKLTGVPPSDCYQAGDRMG